MCGILGFFCDSRREVTESLFSVALARMSHRGPDDHRIRRVEDGFLGHRRLAIIDIDPRSNQPFSLNDRYYLVFNGEIYNYRDLRKSLADEGIDFKTDSDTEVLYHLLIKRGPNCLNALNGMFAFAFYDVVGKKVLLARDRVGKKPLYYFNARGKLFAFASELKALEGLTGGARAVSLEAVHEFLSLGYISAPRTIYENIHKLEPATYMVFDASECVVNYRRRYWYPAQHEHMSERDLPELLRDAINLRLVADVPVGIMLSGGLDSNYILGVANRSLGKAFTIRMDDANYDESEVASFSARHFGIEHEIKRIVPAVDVVDQVVGVYDEPFGDSSALPFLALCRAVRDAKYICVMNGDGGDEVFAGYDRYRMMLVQRAAGWLLSRLPNFDSFGYKSILYNFSRLIELSKNRNPDELYIVQNHINRNFEGELLKKHDLFGELLDRLRCVQAVGYNRYLVYDLLYYLPDDLLVKVDRASMAFSIECRSPLLDYRIIDLMMTIPFRRKLSYTDNKLHLRRVARELLSHEILKRPKRGFQVPIDSWFLNEMRGEVEGLKTSRLVSEGLVDRAYMERIVDSHLGLKRNNKFQIYNMLVMNRWMDMHGWK